MFRLTIILLIASFCIPVWSQETLKPFYSVKAPVGFSKGKTAFENTLKIVKERYYDSKGLTEDDLYYAAIKGVLRKLSPPKTPTQGKIWSVEEKNTALGSLKEKQVFSGIDFEFDRGDGSLKVLKIEKNSPAAGKLKLYDRIMRINGESLKEKTKTSLKKLLSGEEGKIVKLKVVRDIETLDISLELASFKRLYTEAEILNGIGYIRIKSFSETISKEVKAHLKEFSEKKCTKLIIDLRQNTGGYFSEAINTAELFLPLGTPILSVVRSGSKRTDYRAAVAKPYDFKIAVLINKYSASSSEVLASALRANNKAVLIGEKSYGKAIIEKTFSLKNSYYIKFTVGAMYDVNGDNWHERGLTPDIALKGRISLERANDQIIQKAIAVLNKP